MYIVQLGICAFQMPFLYIFIDAVYMYVLTYIYMIVKYVSLTLSMFNLYLHAVKVTWCTPNGPFMMPHINQLQEQ